MTEFNNGNCISKAQAFAQEMRDGGDHRKVTVRYTDAAIVVIVTFPDSAVDPEAYVFPWEDD